VNVAKLGELIRPAKVQRAGSDSYPLLSMTMRHGLVPQGEKFKKRVAGADLSQYKVIERNQLVVGFPIDEAVLAFQRSIPAGIVSPAYGVWDLTDKAVTDALYLERFLRSPQAIAYYKAKLQGSTARRRSLPNPVFLDMEVPFPPLDVQRRIVAILDKTDELRTKRRQALALLDALRLSIFDSMFRGGNFPTTKLAAVATFRYGSSNKSGPEGINCLRIPNVAGREIDWNGLKRVPVTDDELQRLRLRDGDLLFVRSNGNPDFVGRSAVFAAHDEEDAIYASYLIRARFECDSPLTPLFVNSFLATNDGQNQLRAGAKTSAGQYNINIQALGGLRIPAPPLSLQSEFAARIAAVERLRETHRKHLGELDVLFAALQHRAFKGEL